MNNLSLVTGTPFQGEDQRRLKKFMERMGLTYDDGIEYSVCLLDSSSGIVGSGSVEADVIKCVAIDRTYQGHNLMSVIISELIQYQFEKGRTHIFVYTKPENLSVFTEMGFYMVCRTEAVLLMENTKDGFNRFLERLRNETPRDALRKDRKIGAVVANCNPFTLGHRYLLEEALDQCDYIHFFLLSDERGAYSAEERFEMAKMGTKGLDQIILHQTYGYMISAATFPTYFYKDRIQGEVENSRLDLEIFASKIAPPLHITRRFVGTEPYCRVTGSYHERMKKMLPAYGIGVTEVERKVQDGMPISASRVRQCIAGKRMEEIRNIVPEEVYQYLNRVYVDRCF